MNLHKNTELDSSEREIQRLMNDWTKQQVPPSNAKARLLRAAISPKKPLNLSLSHPLPAIPNELMSWAMVYSLNQGATTMHLVR